MDLLTLIIKKDVLICLISNFSPGVISVMEVEEYSTRTHGTKDSSG